MTTEQLTPIKRLHRIIPLIEINDVYLLESSIELMDHPSSIKPDRTIIDQTMNFHWKLSQDYKVLDCVISRVISGFEKTGALDESDKKNSSLKKMFSFKATFSVLYTIKDYDRDPEINFFEDETLRIFTETNAVFNSYPYFREYYHSQCMRSGMEPVILPFLKPITVREINERYT